MRSERHLTRAKGKRKRKRGCGMRGLPFRKPWLMGMSRARAPGLTACGAESSGAEPVWGRVPGRCVTRTVTGLWRRVPFW